MDIIEKDYFGLQYTDANHVPVSVAPLSLQTLEFSAASLVWREHEDLQAFPLLGDDLIVVPEAGSGLTQVVGRRGEDEAVQGLVPRPRPTPCFL